MTIHFEVVQQTGEQPHYVYRGKDAEVEIYYGEPPLAPRGIYVLFHIVELGKVFRVLVRRMDHFDAHELAAVADNFQLNIE